MLNNKNGFPIEQMESAVNTLPLHMPFRLEPRNGNSMRKKKKRKKTLVPTLTVTGVTLDLPPPARSDGGLGEGHAQVVVLAQVVVVQVDERLDGLLHRGHLQEGHLVISSETREEVRPCQPPGSPGTPELCLFHKPVRTQKSKTSERALALPPSPKARKGAY